MKFKDLKPGTMFVYVTPTGHGDTTTPYITLKGGAVWSNITNRVNSAKSFLYPPDQEREVYVVDPATQKIAKEASA